MYGDDDLLPLSALQHLLFCERQCALIHQEQTWADNRLTVEGAHMHQRADTGEHERRGELLTVRSMPLRSARLGLSGRADVVEFRPTDGLDGAALRGSEGRWLPRPVEYKRGRPKRHRADEVQLCAQGLCLEEMFGVHVLRGDLFYGKRKRRSEVSFDATLRQMTSELSGKLHELMAKQMAPAAEYEFKKCDSCSLMAVCLPKVSTTTTSYVDRALDH